MISNNIKYIGVRDNDIDLFEGQYQVEKGITYNSYVIIDDKVAIMDTVDSNFTSEWLANLNKALDGKTPNYLVIHHVEPDHSGSIIQVLDKYPNLTVVSNQKAFGMLANFYDLNPSNQLVVNNQEKLELGNHTLVFNFAPMVHWPEVMVSYEEKEGILFSADAFGKFGLDEEWEDEARRYYFGIVGKYGVQANKLVQFAKTLKINAICPLHGPMLPEEKKDISYYLDLYDKWTKYEPTDDGVVICYSSVYGNTKKASLTLATELERKGTKVMTFDLSRVDLSVPLGYTFKYNKLVLASVTYNGDVFPSMKDFLNRLVERQFQNHTVAFIENGSWAALSGKVMKASLENLKNLTFIENVVSLKSGFKDSDLERIKELAITLK